MNNPTIGFHHKITLLCIVRGNTEIKNYNSTHDTSKNFHFAVTAIVSVLFGGSSRSLNSNRQELNTKQTPGDNLKRSENLKGAASLCHPKGIALSAVPFICFIYGVVQAWLFGASMFSCNFLISLST